MADSGEVVAPTLCTGSVVFRTSGTDLVHEVGRGSSEGRVRRRGEKFGESRHERVRRASLLCTHPTGKWK
jgi:hypothetical protein